jgi:hypothetical protein
MRVLENMAGRKREGITRGWRRFHKERQSDLNL